MPELLRCFKSERKVRPVNLASAHRLWAQGWLVCGVDAAVSCGVNDGEFDCFRGCGAAGG